MRKLKVITGQYIERHGPFREEYFRLKEPDAKSIFCKNRHDDAVNEHGCAHYGQQSDQDIRPGEFVSFNVRHEASQIFSLGDISEDQINRIDQERATDDPDIKRYL